MMMMITIGEIEFKSGRNEFVVAILYIRGSSRGKKLEINDAVARKGGGDVKRRALRMTMRNRFSPGGR